MKKERIRKRRKKKKWGGKKWGEKEIGERCLKLSHYYILCKIFIHKLV